MNDPPSLYAQTAGPWSPRPPLTGTVRAEICVIGGGYTGLSAALHAAAAGRDVRLLEAQSPGFGASGRNGGQVGSGQRIDHAELADTLGKATARALWDLAEDAKALLRKLITTHGIDCEWRDGIVYLHRREPEGLRDRLAVLAARMGYASCEPLDRKGVAKATGARGFASGIRDAGAAHLHPLRLALGLAAAAERAGAILHDDSRVEALEGGPPWRAITRQGIVTADTVVLAGNGYLSGLCDAVDARVLPINNFMIATAPLGDGHSDILPGGEAACDDRFVVRYWRLTPDRRLIFGGGESYGDRFPADIVARVRPNLVALYPQLAETPITHAWGGTLAVTRSRLPYLARPAPGLLTASGYNGHGVALAVLSGKLLAEAIAGPSEGFDRMAALPVPPFPGGRRLRHPILTVAMSFLALRDRLRI